MGRSPRRTASPSRKAERLSSYDTIRGLPLHVDGIYLEPLEAEAARDFTLRRTTVVLHGRGEEGRGEDIDYDPRQQERFQQGGDRLPVQGEHTLESFSLLQSGQSDYRRWALESAALDLALRQAGLSLAGALGLEPRPVRFVVSTRAANVESWLELYPDLRFKLDPGRDWGDELLASLAATDRVDTVDFKGIYRHEFGSPPDPQLYAQVIGAFPDAWIEDPAITPATLEVLDAHRDRITWDAGIHGVGDIDALPFAPRCLNCKPSRFGSVRRLFDFYDACLERGIQLYGGGQFELGVGRAQIQLLASLFHPDAPNDVAPGGYNSPEPTPGLPSSPLTPSPAAGFGT